MHDFNIWLAKDETKSKLQVLQGLATAQTSNIKALAEVKREPKKLTFPRAILTSVISVLFTLLICYGLFKIGTLLSGKVMTIIGKIL